MPFKDLEYAKAHKKFYDRYIWKHPAYRGAYTHGKMTPLYDTLSDLLETRSRYGSDNLAIKVVKAIATAMTQALQRGDYITIKGIGTWRVKTYAARKRVQASSGGGHENPSGHFIADIPERRGVIFKPCPSLRNIDKEITP